MREYSDFVSSYMKNYGRYQIIPEELQFYVTYLLSNYCMPSLTGIKPSCLIRVNKGNITEIQLLHVLLDNVTAHFECQYSVLYENEITLILLIYHKELLYQTILAPENSQFMVSYGYELHGDIVKNVILQVKHKYTGYEEQRKKVQLLNLKNRIYPHEIGVILGFPIMDVKDFIRFCGRNYKYCGYWKVYHDVYGALKIFERYDTARDDAVRQILAGKRLQDIRSIRKKGGKET